MITKFNTLGWILIAFVLTQQISAEKKLKVGYYGNAPMISKSDDGEAHGIFIDFFESVADQEGWEIEYVYDSFGNLMEAVENGQIDVLPCVSSSYERLKVLSFTRQPLLENWAILLRRKDVAVNNFFDLEGKRVTSLRGDIHQVALRKLLDRYEINCEIIEVDDYETAVQMLDHGKSDIAAVSRTFSTNLGSFFNSISTLLIYNPIPLHYAFPKGEHLDVIHALDEAYVSQSKDPNSPLLLSMARLLKPETKNEIPLWAYILGLILLILVLAGILAALLLKTMVNRRTLDLQKETLRATEALRAQNLFLATLSHELRTPLNFIVGPLELLRDDSDLTREERNELFDNCRSGIDRLQHLMLSLLRFSKVGHGNFNLEKKPVELHSLFEEIKKVAEALPRGAEVSFQAKIEVDEELIGLTDEDAIFQISLNLLHNALKFTEKGSVDFLAQAKLKRDKIILFIKVKDTGKGIPEANHDSIFTPFLKGTDSNYVEAGTGLGLSIVDRFVKSFQGELDFTSRENIGTTFRIVLVLETSSDPTE